MLRFFCPTVYVDNCHACTLPDLDTLKAAGQPAAVSEAHCTLEYNEGEKT